MTTAGGIGHTLPYLIPEFRTATAIAVVIVAIELLAISWIRKRYTDTPFLRAAFQVIVRGGLGLSGWNLDWKFVSIELYRFAMREGHEIEDFSAIYDYLTTTQQTPPASAKA